MNLTEYMLTKLGEECNEVAQRVSKAQCFGLDEMQPDQPLTNRVRINYEINDILATLEVMRDLNIFDFQADEKAIEAKKEKIRKYMRYSKELGMLQV